MTMMMMEMTLKTVCRRLFLPTLMLLLVVRTNLNGQVSAFHNVCLVIPEMAIIDIEPNTNPINLSLIAPNEAGGKATALTSSDSKWINYSSTFPIGGTTRSILVQAQNTIPLGMRLNILAANYSGSGGGGTFGASTGTKSLSTTPQALISGIGRSYTGNGANRGHKITFALEITDYKLLNSNESKTLTIIYTITD